MPSPATAAPATVEELALTPVAVDLAVPAAIDRRATYHRDHAEALASGKKRRRRKSPVTLNHTPYRLYQRRGRYWIDFIDPVTHERVRKPLKRRDAPLGTTHEREAEALARELWNARFEHAQRVALGAAPTIDPSTVALVPQYLEWLFRQPVGDAHKADTARCLRYLLANTLFGKVADVRHITGPTISALDDELSTKTWTHKTRAGGLFTPGMRRNYLLKASAFCEWCRTEHGLMQGNPFHRHRVFRGKTPERPADHFYEFHEVAHLLDRAWCERVTAKIAGNREILAFLTYTGARIGEALRVRPEDIDFARDVVTIRSAKKGRWKETAPDTRTVPLWPPLKRVLLEYFARHRPHHWPLLFPDWRWMQQPSGARQPMQRRAPYGWLAGLCRRANIDFKHGCHVLRHTYASARLRMAVAVLTANGEKDFVSVPYEVVRVELGHSPNAARDTLRRVYTKAITMPRVAMTFLDYHEAARHTGPAPVRAEAPRGVLLKPPVPLALGQGATMSAN